MMMMMVMMNTRQYVHRMTFSTLGECNIYFRNVVLQVVHQACLDFCPSHPPRNMQEASFNDHFNSVDLMSTTNAPAIQGEVWSWTVQNR